MPFLMRRVDDFNDPVLVAKIKKIYDLSPEFADGESAVQELALSMAQGNCIYIGEFNDNIIAAVWCLKQAQACMLQYIIVHPANRGRGLAEQLCTFACDDQAGQGVSQFIPGCGAIRRVLTNIKRLPQ